MEKEILEKNAPVEHSEEVNAEVEKFIMNDEVLIN